jgi:lipopolysaccharide assembly outer membrane protein LptD (OstA)
MRTRLSPHICLLGFCVLSLAPAGALAQQGADSLQTRRDSVVSRGTGGQPPRTDTLLSVQSPSGIDSVVTYSAADSIVYLLSDRTMYLHGKGSITYKELGLKAEAIDIDWNTSTLHAQGVPDTADTSGKGYIGQPEMIDGGEAYDGSELSYNFRTKRGRIRSASTEIEQGFYHGDVIKRVDVNAMFVAGGRYTTCDLEHPHYYFASPQMKVMVKDKVVAEPVYLYIADVPVFALPFGIFPNERGRRSGIIAPAYGESARGRYLLHLGYYWAINDYMDWNIRGDGYTKGSWVLYSDFRYALRYNFTGSVSGSYARTITGERGDPNYASQKLFNLRWRHDQEFDPTMRLVVDFTFTSGSYYQQTSFNLADLLQQNIVSNATLTKFWEGTPNSMTINISRDQNLQAQENQVEVNEVLPSISFNRSQTYPFRFGKRTSVGEGLAWYELVGYSYSGQFQNVRTTTKQAAGSALEERRGVLHTLPLNMALKVGYFNFTPFFNYTEKWYEKRTEKSLDPTTRMVVESREKGFSAIRTYNLGVSATTKIYGIFQPGVFGIKGIRHQVTPTVSYTYQPDFSQARFGYYRSYRDTSGNEVRYDPFAGEVFGGVPAGERQAISLSIGNVFEMKTESADTAATENKFQLLNLGLNIAYNFAADSLKFSELGMDFRTSIGQVLSIGGSSRFNLYAFDVDPVTQQGRRVNKFLINERGQLAQLTSFNIQIGTRLSGEKKETKAGPVKTVQDSLALRERGGYVGILDQEEVDFSIPWNLDLTWNFNQNQTDPRFKFRSSNLAIGLGFNLTQFWKISASASYDILNQQFAAPQITVYRDLHCWEMNFSWVPTGQYRYYRFEIRLKAPQLQDVKLTKQSSARGII